MIDEQSSRLRLEVIIDEQPSRGLVDNCWPTMIDSQLAEVHSGALSPSALKCSRVLSAQVHSSALSPRALESTQVLSSALSPIMLDWHCTRVRIPLETPGVPTASYRAIIRILTAIIRNSYRNNT